MELNMRNPGLPIVTTHVLVDTHQCSWEVSVPCDIWDIRHILCFQSTYIVHVFF